MLPSNPFNNNRNSNRNRPRPLNPQDSALTTGLVSNPNGTYVSNPYPTTAQNGMQGQYGSMLPQVQVQPTFLQQLVGYNPNTTFQDSTPFWDTQTGQNLSTFTDPVKDAFQRLTGQKPFYGAYGQGKERATRHQTAADQLREYQASKSAQASQASQATAAGQLPVEYAADASDRSYASYRNTVHGLEQRFIGETLAALSAGDMTALANIPASDLEAMGLGEYAQYGVGGGANPATKGSGIGTGIDEGAEMTPSQLEARYWQNRETEAEFLKQKRWDAKRKRYISVGQWMKQERGKYNRQGRRRSNRDNTPAPAAEEARYTIQAEGSPVNTATG